MSSSQTKAESKRPFQLLLSGKSQNFHFQIALSQEDLSYMYILHVFELLVMIEGMSKFCVKITNV